MLVKNIIQSRIQNSSTSAKQTDDIYTTKTDYKKTRHKGKSEGCPILSTRFYRRKQKFYLTDSLYLAIRDILDHPTSRVFHLTFASH